MMRTLVIVQCMLGFASGLRHTSYSKDVQCAKADQDSILQRLEDRMKQGPVHFDVGNTITKPVNVFLMSPAYWGSTALLSLVASSPYSTTLCSANSWACEGQMISMRRGMIDNNNILPGHTFGDVMKVYEEYWDAEKPVKIEKSPWSMEPNITYKIADHFKGRENEVAFIFITRSPCSCKGCGEYAGSYIGITNKILRAMDDVKGYRSMVIKYEDLIQDPYGTAENVLKFLPALQSLDPNVNVIPTLNNYAMGEKQDRAKSIVNYTLGYGVKRPRESVRDHEYDRALQMGYNSNADGTLFTKFRSPLQQAEDMEDDIVMSGTTIVEFCRSLQ